MKYLSFDLGLKHTGVAGADETQLATGLTTITAVPSQLLPRLFKLIDQYQPQVIIIGRPAHGPIHRLTLQVASELRQTKLAIHQVDETRSTRVAQRALISGGARRQARQTRQHQAAAAAILQEYLDNLIK